MAVSCTESAIYQNNSYALYPDKVTQGEYTAEVCSPYKVVSDFGGDTLVWEKKNDLVDYFLLHDFFQLALEAYPEHWEQVVPVSSATPHILLLRMFEPYDQSLWSVMKQQTPFHKLSYKFAPEQAAEADTFYAKLLTE